MLMFPSDRRMWDKQCDMVNRTGERVEGHLGVPKGSLPNRILGPEI